jgi:Glu-tRNA(Gln) amidotransferase subunit E-like FAD-binding protein
MTTKQFKKELAICFNEFQKTLFDDEKIKNVIPNFCEKFKMDCLAKEHFRNSVRLVLRGSFDKQSLKESFDVVFSNRKWILQEVLKNN